MKEKREKTQIPEEEILAERWIRIQIKKGTIFPTNLKTLSYQTYRRSVLYAFESGFLAGRIAESEDLIGSVKKIFKALGDSLSEKNKGVKQ